jgi:hypothetical protein
LPNGTAINRILNSSSRTWNAESAKSEGDSVYALRYLGVPKAARIVLVGDSHRDHLLEEFWRTVAPIGIGVALPRNSPSPSVMGLTTLYASNNGDEGRVKVGQTNNWNFKNILADVELKYVVLANRWTARYHASSFDNGEGGKERDRQKAAVPFENGGIVRIDEVHRKSAVLAAYSNTVRAVLSSGKTVILVYPVPEVGWNVRVMLAKKRLLESRHWDLLVPNRLFDPEVSTSYQHYLERNREVIENFDNIGEHPNLVRIRPDKLLCDTYLKGRCVATLNGEPLYNDDDHLSNMGARLVVDEIMRKVDFNSH